jgi:hypothetical protein
LRINIINRSKSLILLLFFGGASPINGEGSSDQAHESVDSDHQLPVESLKDIWFRVDEAFVGIAGLLASVAGAVLDDLNSDISTVKL